MKRPHPDWIVPHWPAAPRVRAFVTTRAAPRVRAFVTTRAGGVSPAPYHSLNLGRRTADHADNTARNRAILRAALPADPVWLNQVHGAGVVEAGPAAQDAAADAAWTATPGVVCAVMTADCMPVLFAARDGSRVAAAHAGWRGLAGGVLEATVDALGLPGAALMAWLGPAIGPAHFEVGEDVRQAFCAADAGAGAAFRPYPDRPGKWLCDLYALARRRLAACGIETFGGDLCTVADRRFFSHRRDRGLTGRMAALVWIAPGDRG